MAGMEPTGTPYTDPPSEEFIEVVSMCQNQVAWFTMHDADYDKYIEIQDDFLTAVTPYAEFRRRMGVLLDLQGYQHLRIFWDIYHRAVHGEELWEDNIMCLFPVVLSYTLDLFVYSVKNENTLRNWVREPDPERESDLEFVRELEASRIRSYWFTMAGRDSIRDPIPDLSSGVLLLCFLNWCQEQVARVIMRPRHYRAYLSITLELRDGIIPYYTFMYEMRAVLRNPRYQVLRVWWNVHKLEVCGLTRMMDNPMLHYPLALFITTCLEKCCERFGFPLWFTYLKNVRRCDGDDV